MLIRTWLILLLVLVNFLLAYGIAIFYNQGKSPAIMIVSPLDAKIGRTAEPRLRNALLVFLYFGCRSRSTAKASPATAMVWAMSSSERA